MDQPDESLTSVAYGKEGPAPADTSFHDEIYLKPSTPDPNAPGFGHGMVMGNMNWQDVCYNSTNLTTSLATSSLMPYDQWEQTRPLVFDGYIEQAKSLEDRRGNMAASSDFYPRGSIRGERTKPCKLRKNMSAEEKLDILNSILQASSVKAASCMISKHQKTWHNLYRYARKVLTKAQLTRVREIVDQCKLQGLVLTEETSGHDKARCEKLNELGTAPDVQMTTSPGLQSPTSVARIEKKTPHKTLLDVTDPEVSFGELLNLLGSGLDAALQSLQGKYQSYPLEDGFFYSDLQTILILPGTSDMHPIWTFTKARFGPDTIGQLVRLRGSLVCIRMC